MRKVAAILALMLIASSSFAASDKCSSMLASLVLNAKEGARLNAAAIHHGYDIYTGEVENIDNQSRFAKDYMRLSGQYLEKAEILEERLNKDCLK